MLGGKTSSREKFWQVGKKHVVCVCVYALQRGAEGGHSIFPPHAIHGCAVQHERQRKRKPEDRIGKLQWKDFCHWQNWKWKLAARIIRTPIGVGYRNVRNSDNPRAY